MVESILDSIYRSRVRGAEVIASIIYSTPNGDIKQLSQKVIELKEKGIEPDLAIRKIPGGYYSEDIAQYISLLCSYGYVKSLSPLKLTAIGKKNIRKVIEDAYNREPKEMQKILSALKLNIKKILDQKIKA
jgi:hypothetical protein